MEANFLIEEKQFAYACLHRACQQVQLLNRSLVEVQQRYDRSVAANQRSHHYRLRLRLASLEGIRDMYYEYASRKAKHVMQLNAMVEAEDVEFEDYEEEEMEADEETVVV